MTSVWRHRTGQLRVDNNSDYIEGGVNNNSMNANRKKESSNSIRRNGAKQKMFRHDTSSIDIGDWDSQTDVSEEIFRNVLMNDEDEDNHHKKSTIRRRMKWRMGSMQKKNSKSKHQQNNMTQKNNDYRRNSNGSPSGSIAGDSVDGSRTVKSFHTLHSTETLVVKNQKQQLDIQKLQSSQNSALYSRYLTIAKDNHRSDDEVLSHRLKTWTQSRGLPRYQMENCLHSRESNYQTPQKKKSQTTETWENSSEISPCGTLSTAPSSTNSAKLNYSYDDEGSNTSDGTDNTDSASIIAMQPSEDYEGNRTVGLFLFDNASQQNMMPKPPSPPDEAEKSMPPRPARSMKGKPPRTPRIPNPYDATEISYSPSSSSVRKKLTYDSDASNLNELATSSSHFSNHNDYVEAGHDRYKNEPQEDEFISSNENGPLWELAGLQAISEGIAHTPEKFNTNINNNNNNGNNQGVEESKSETMDADTGRFVQAERNLRAIQDLAERHLMHGEYAEALEVFQEILRGQKEMYGTNHHRIGTALHNIGIVHMRAGNFENAALVSKCAVEVRKRVLGPDHLDIAVSLSQLGIALLELDEHKKALFAFREVFTIRRKRLGSNHPKVAKVLNNIGCCLFELKELKGALMAYEEALDIQKNTMRNQNVVYTEERGFSSPDKLLLSIAATLCNIGSVKLRQMDFDGSILALEEALLLQQSVLSDNHPTVRNTVDSINFVDNSRTSTKGQTNNVRSINHREHKMLFLFFEVMMTHAYPCFVFYFSHDKMSSIQMSHLQKDWRDIPQSIIIEMKTS